MPTIMYKFDLSTIIAAEPYIIQGLLMTIFISVISCFLAFFLGIILVFLRKSQDGFFKFIIVFFIELTRNTPLLIQLYIWYKGLSSININLNPVLCGIAALSIYTGVFISEVLRAGINSIAKEQTNAAMALGLSKIQTFRFIILPQAIKIVIPPLGSQFINLVKNSSLVSFITVTDVFYVVYKEAVDNFRFFEFFLIGALIYMTLTGILSLLTNVLERKLKQPRKVFNT